MWYKLDKENNPIICNDFQGHQKALDLIQTIENGK